MGFRIERVIGTGEIPEGCGHCDYIESREKGRSIVYECYFVPGFIKNQNVRLAKCPLVILAENERFGIFRLVGKGKPHINNEMWIESESEQ